MRPPGKFLHWLLLLVLLQAWGALSAADAWRYGAVYVPELPDGLVLQPIGGQAYQASDLPGYFSGLVRMSGAAREGLYWQASNAVQAAYFGPGEFSIERFEQDRLEAEGARSRMILSMASGRLMLDSREMHRDAQILIELPMGRIHLKQALISIEISHDERSGIYDFQMISADGQLRFTDNQGQQFFASETQLLTGVGSSYAPSLEVSDLTRRIREGFSLFTDEAEAVLSVDGAGFASHMVAVPQAEDTEAEPELAVEVKDPEPEGERRPVVIEYVPRAKPLVPFRGEAKPLSEGEAALF